jgi:hypothetical protein
MFKTRKSSDPAVTGQGILQCSKFTEDNIARKSAGWGNILSTRKSAVANLES